MRIEAFEKRNQLLDLRKKIVKAEKERLRGVKTITLDEARNKLKRRLR